MSQRTEIYWYSSINLLRIGIFLGYFLKSIHAILQKVSHKSVIKTTEKKFGGIFLQ